MSGAVRRQRVRIQPYVDAQVAKRVTSYSAARGLTESAVVQAALCQYLDGTSDTALVLRRLDRLGRAGARTQRDLEVLTESFGVWLKIWFAHTPSVAEDAKQFARATAESRYRQFVEYVAEQLSDGHRFLDDLPREVIADEVELTRTSARGDSTLGAPQGEPE